MALTVYHARGIVRQSAPLLALLVVVQTAAGQVLNLESDVLFAAPILLTLVPAVNAVGGNVGSVLGARIASGLHLGTVTTDLRGRELHRNVAGALLAGAITFLVLALLILTVAPFLPVDLTLGAVGLVVVLLATGLLLTLSLVVIAVLSAFESFRRGLDPDNTVIPIVTSLGDLLGIIWLTVVYGVVA